MSLLFVDVDVPSEIGLDGLLQNINNIGATHGNVVFETVFADVFHQFLQVIYLCYSDATVHSVGIVGQFALAQIGFDAALGIVGGKSEKGEVALRHFRIDRTKGVDLAQGASTPRGPSRSWSLPINERGKLPQWVHTHLLRSSAKLLFQSSRAGACPDARLSAYIDTAPAKSVSQAAGMSLSLSIDMVTHAAQP